MVETPADVQRRLAALFANGYDEVRLAAETYVNIVDHSGELPPLFLPIHAEAAAILNELKPLHEAWSSTALVPTHAFGFRIYRRGNVLKRHVDRLATHVVSSIVHVASEVDAPWPIVIEDVHGVEHAVALKPGQMLFYESAKLAHARPAPFQGRFYTSIFLHYKPKDWPVLGEEEARAILDAELPPDWDRDTIAQQRPPRNSRLSAASAPHQEL